MANDLAQIQIQVQYSEVTKATKAMNDLRKAGKAVDGTTASVKRQAGANNVLASSNKNVAATSKAASTATKGFATSVKTLYRSMLPLLTAFGAFAAIKNTFSTLISFEEGLVGVGKTADITGQQLADLGEEIASLATFVPQTTNELLAIAQAAGQLGIKGSENILLFTKTIAQLGTAGDLGGERAATTLARLLTVTGESIDTVDELASVITRLGNNFAATESEIAAVATRVAQGGAAFDVTSSQAAAIGAALKAAGIEAERGGTLISKTFKVMEKAAIVGGDSLQTFANIAGTTQEEFADAFAGDSVKAFELFIKGLQRVDAAGDSISVTLEDLGLSGERVAPGLATLAANVTELSRALNDAEQELRDPTTLTEEFAKANSTLASALKRLRSVFSEIVLQFKDSNGPLKEAVDVFADFLRVIFGLPSASKEAAAGVSLIAKPVRDLLGLLSSAGGAVMEFIGFLLGAEKGARKFRAVLFLLSPSIASLLVPIRGTIKLLKAFGSITVETSEGVVSFGDIFVATVSLVVERVRIFAAITARLFELTKTKVLDFAGAVGTVLKNTFSKFGGEYFGLVKDGVGVIMQAIKGLVNFVVQSAVAIDGTLDAVLTRFNQLIGAFAQLDFSSTEGFATSAKAAAKSFADALKPGPLLQEVEDSWSQAFQKDFVGDFLGEVKKFGGDLKQAINTELRDLASADPELSALFGELQASGGLFPDDILDEILTRAADRSKSSGLKEQLRAANEEVQKFNDSLTASERLYLRSQKAAQAAVAETNAQLKEQRELLETELKLLDAGFDDSKISRVQKLQEFIASQKAIFSDKDVDFTFGAGKEELDLLIAQYQANLDLIQSTKDRRAEQKALDAGFKLRSKLILDTNNQLSDLRTNIDALAGGATEQAAQRAVELEQKKRELLEAVQQATGGRASKTFVDGLIVKLEEAFVETNKLKDGLAQTRAEARVALQLEGISGKLSTKTDQAAARLKLLEKGLSGAALEAALSLDELERSLRNLQNTTGGEAVSEEDIRRVLAEQKALNAANQALVTFNEEKERAARIAGVASSASSRFTSEIDSLRTSVELFSSGASEKAIQETLELNKLRTETLAQLKEAGLDPNSAKAQAIVTQLEEEQREVHALAAEYENLQKQRKAAEDITKIEVSIRSNADALKRELQFLEDGLFGESLADALEIDELTRQIRELQALQGLDPDSPEAKAEAERIIELKKQYQETGDAVERLKQRHAEAVALGEQVGASFGDAFVGFITGAKTAEEAISGLLQQITQLAAQRFIVDFFSQTAGGIFGNVFGGGGGEGNGGGILGSLFTGFAKGGGFNKGSVINSPTPFSFSGGLGVAGERGPEAVVPLVRGSDGNLGVGGGGQSTTNITFNVQAPNPDGFRRSQPQLVEQARAALGG